MTLRHRIALAPMCQYSARDGFPTDWHFRHYAERAVGGASLIILEATAVVPEGRISPWDLGLWNDEQGRVLARLVETLHGYGAKVGVQLAHAGRKASTDTPWNGGKFLEPHQGGWPVRAPSALAFSAAAAPPSPLSESEIELAVKAFALAAQRAHQAGFDTVEIHAAHGYLLHQFLSPLSNQRQDGWGGPLCNRLRLSLSVAEAIRSVWPAEKPLLARVSATDWVEGGWNLADTVELARGWKALGVDLVDVSSGGLVPNAQIPVAPGYQVPFSAAVREQGGLATGAVGLLQDVEQIRAVIAEQKADLIFLGRQLLRDPYWPLRHAPAEARKVPLQYQRAF